MGDCISRQSVEEIINDIRDCISVDGYWAILERLKKLPSVTPKQKMGRWIKVVTEADYLGNETYHYECSECGFKSFFGTERYCPNCGAKMVEPQESEDTE